MSRCAIAIAAALVCQATLFATSVEQVSFDDMVTRADVIFVGEVVDVHAFPVNTPNGQIIKTRVTFSIADGISGTKGLVEVFDFLGGEVNGVGMGVSGMPTFHVGERRLVFARRDRSINPIVGFTQGLMQVVRDANGVDRVLTLDGQPIGDVDAIGTQRTGSSPSTPMRLSDIRDRIARVRAQVKKP